jgi:putative heme iron utilization protein
MTDDLPHMVRELIRSRDRAVLATALPDANGGAPWPYASLVVVAVDHDLAPILLLSDLADHSRAIAADDRVSLLFDGTEGLDDPLTGARVSLLGRAAPTDDERLKRRFLAHHPEADMYARFGDFKFYRVAVERAHLVGGFGKIRWLSADELMPSGPPAAREGFAAAEGAILAHMNADHADAVQLYATRLLGRVAGEWRMTGLDAEGLDLRCGGKVARLAFDTALNGPAQVREALASLAAKARTVDV